MDFETGEMSNPCDMETGEDIELNHHTCDTETGEIAICSRDKETGETSYWIWKHKPFKVPRSYYTPRRPKYTKKRHKLRKACPQESQLITAAIYLLPTMVFFHPILCVFAVIVEIILHTWSHKRNKELGTDAIYFYQSPLHGIVKEFCGKCKDETAAIKISKIKDRQNYNRFGKQQLEYFKQVIT